MIDLSSPVSVSVKWTPVASAPDELSAHLDRVDALIRPLVGQGQWFVVDSRERSVEIDGLADGFARAAARSSMTISYQPVGTHRASESAIVLSTSTPIDVRIPLAAEGGMDDVLGLMLVPLVELLAAESRYVDVQGHDGNCGLYHRLSGVDDRRFYDWGFTLTSAEVEACGASMDQPEFTVIEVPQGAVAIWYGSVASYWKGAGVAVQRSMIERILPPVSIRAYRAVGESRMPYLVDRVAPEDLRDPEG